MSLIASLGACSRTGLDTLGAVQSQPPSDAGADTSTPVVAPLCLTPLTPGALRFKLRSALSGAAIDANGNYFVPIITAGHGVDLLSVDPCGAERWRLNVTNFSTVDDPQFVVRLVPGGDIILEAHIRFTDDGMRFYQFSTAGTAYAPFNIDKDRYGGILGVVPGSGLAFLLEQPTGYGTPSFVEYNIVNNPVSESPGFESPQDVCAMGTDGSGGPSSAYVYCVDLGYSVASHSVIWKHAHENLDGTSLHILPPALDGDRIVALVFGISTYDLVFRSRATGQETNRTHLAQSTRGQVDLLAGRPVIGSDGTTYVYLNVHRDGEPDGQLMAIGTNGAIRWTFPAPASKEEYFHDEGLVIGQGGIIYLAVGSRLYAVDRNGTEIWSTATTSLVNDSAPALSPFGDIALHTDDHTMLVYATDSKGLDPSPWPSAYANSGHTNTN